MGSHVGIAYRGGQQDMVDGGEEGREAMLVSRSRMKSPAQVGGYRHRLVGRAEDHDPERDGSKTDAATAAGLCAFLEKGLQDRENARGPSSD